MSPSARVRARLIRRPPVQPPVDNPTPASFDTGIFTSSGSTPRIEGDMGERHPREIKPPPPRSPR